MKMNVTVMALITTIVLINDNNNHNNDTSFNLKKS